MESLPRHGEASNSGKASRRSHALSLVSWQFLPLPLGEIWSLFTSSTLALDVVLGEAVRSSHVKCHFVKIAFEKLRTSPPPQSPNAKSDFNKKQGKTEESPPVDLPVILLSPEREQSRVAKPGPCSTNHASYAYSHVAAGKVSSVNRAQDRTFRRNLRTALANTNRDKETPGQNSGSWGEDG